MGESLRASDEAAGGIPGALGLVERILLEGEPRDVPPGEAALPQPKSELPEDFLRVVLRASIDLARSSERFGRAFPDRGGPEVEWARAHAWMLPLEGDNPEMRAASTSEPSEEDRRRLYTLAEGMDEAVLAGCVRLVWDAAARIAAAAPEEAVASKAGGEKVDGVEGDLLLAIETEAGWVLVGGPGPNVYSREALLIVDLGGDDRYLDGAGGGDARRGQVVSAIVDLSGDDTYRSDLPVAQGAGYFGIGCLLDLRGDDTYRGSNLVQGAGIFGAGILVDRGGDDSYSADTAAQGAGILGYGILRDEIGRDRYDAAFASQAYAGVLGVGILTDLAGNDLYRAGGTYLHRPLFSDRYRSLSQGFSIGDRDAEAGGGVALLYDGGGNDAYVADIYGQGSSYWYSVGMLVDRDGHDSYTLGQYGQGGGIHLSTGILIDLGGDDNYHCQHGVGQGGGHDYAVGILLDRDGNDYYSGAGLTQGAGNANGVGILLDRWGNDAYAGSRRGIQGHGNPARSYESIGILVDLGGADRYSEGGKDDSVWRGGQRGVGLDRVIEREEEKE